MNSMAIAAKLGVLAGLIGIAVGGFDVPLRDPWFVVFVTWWVFSAVTAGMPEPESILENGRTFLASPLYLWAYRTMHIMSQSGTSYFGHRSTWTSRRPDDSSTQNHRGRDEA